MELNDLLIPCHCGKGIMKFDCVGPLAANSGRYYYRCLENERHMDWFIWANELENLRYRRVFLRSQPKDGNGVGGFSDFTIPQVQSPRPPEGVPSHATPNGSSMTNYYGGMPRSPDCIWKRQSSVNPSECECHNTPSDFSVIQPKYESSNGGSTAIIAYCCIMVTAMVVILPALFITLLCIMKLLK